MTTLARTRTFLTSAAARRRRLGPRARKAVLALHVVSAGAWIGIDVVLAVLVFTALLTQDVRTAAVSYQALGLFAIWPLLAAGLACLATGLVLGLGTKYGLVRYWWVAVKLVINVVFVLLVPLGLVPTVNAAVEYGREIAASERFTFEVDELIFPPVVSPIGLLIAVFLAVYKPWGRVRKRRRDQPRRAQR
ncbi:hypothetical protein SAMN04487905_101544 [Actinopolyspora xinjiangensis]|uniref:DUF2269 domain-containing protein n=1 Tax=Actinopolyspora xinjiangensis TaxID=405564 RepID=A0A1H0PHT1_9ACTN|nr:hypothetical protein [Actinopolyspora xinjiangensis]SDP04229.1 hypothetical protein SAMN04487905_101544 [Actinopolyspora xinjiangensis]